MSKYDFGKYLNDYENISEYIDGIEVFSDNQFRYKCILQELVERATPKKFKVCESQFTDSKYSYCDCMNMNIVSETYYGVSFCPNCGQAIGWSDSD